MASIYETVKQKMAGYYGVDPQDLTLIDELRDKTAMAESDNGKNTVSDISSARGVYQFLTKDQGVDPETGQRRLSAFEVGLNRLVQTLGEEPEWVIEARKHRDPNLLTRDQQDALFLADIFQKKGTDPYIKALLAGDKRAIPAIYAKFHHTNEDITQNKRLRKIFEIT